MTTQQETAASVQHFRSLIQLSAEYPDRWEDVIHFCDSVREGDDAMTISAVRALEASIESVDPRECAAGLRFLEITVKNFYDPKGKSVRANPLQDILVDLFTDAWIARFHHVASTHPHNESIRNFLRGCICEWVQSLPSSMRTSPSKTAMLELSEQLEQPVPTQPTAPQSRTGQRVAQPVMTAPGVDRPEQGDLLSTDAGPTLPQHWPQQSHPPTRAPPPLPNNAAATLGSPHPDVFLPHPDVFLRAGPATTVPQGIPIPPGTAFRGGPGPTPAGHVATGLPVQPPGLGDEAMAAAQAEAEARERAFAADLERALELSRTESQEHQASAFTEDQALRAALEISRLEEAERLGGAAQLEAVLQVSQLEAEAQLERNRQATLRDELQHAYALLTKSQEEKKRELQNIDEEMAVAAGGQGDWGLITELSKQHSLLEEEAKAVGKCRELVLNTVSSLDSMKDLVARENASEAEVGLLEERALQTLIAALTEHSQDTPTDSVGSAIYRELQEKFGERWDTPAEDKKLTRKGSGAFGWLRSKLSDFSNKGKEVPPSKPQSVGSASQGAAGKYAGVYVPPTSVPAAESTATRPTLMKPISRKMKAEWQPLSEGSGPSSTPNPNPMMGDLIDMSPVDEAPAAATMEDMEQGLAQLRAAVALNRSTPLGEVMVPSPGAGSGAPPPPPPPPPGAMVPGAATGLGEGVQRCADVVAAYQAVRRELYGACGGAGSTTEGGNSGKVQTTRRASNEAVLGELHARSEHHAAVRSEVEQFGPVIENLSAAIKDLNAESMDVVCQFVEVMDGMLGKLADETLVLREFKQCWPEAKVDAMRDAVALHRQLKQLKHEAATFQASCGLSVPEACAEIEEALEKLQQCVEHVNRNQDATISRFLAHKLPWDTTLVCQVKQAALQYAAKYMRCVLEAQPSPASPEAVRLLQDTVAFAFKVHQLVGGFNQECSAAFAHVQHLLRESSPQPEQ